MKRDCTCPRVRHVHGTRDAYHYDRCRCLRCQEANRDWQRSYRRIVAERQWGARPEAWTSSAGTLRRLQALAAAGWSAAELGPHLGVTDSGVYQLRNASRPQVLVATAERVAAVYDRLADLSPTGNAVARTRLWAAKNGWLPPIAWDDDTIDDPDAQPWQGEPVDLDEIAVERYIAGTLKHRPQHPHTPELVEAVRRMRETGLSSSEIGRRVGLTGDAVVKLRERRLGDAA